MSAKHTPGPWKVYDPEMPDTEATYGIDGPNGQPVVYFGLTQNDGINRLEDARLIAAAPDLLDFAQEWLERQGTDENYMTAKARDAIAKAIR